MKKLFISTGLVLSLFTGCSDFLEENLQGIYTSETFYQTNEHAMLALTAAYQPMSFSSIRNPLWVFGDVASDDAIKGGIPGDQSEIEFIEQFTYTQDNGFLGHIWQRYFEGISRSNDVIHRLGAGVNEDIRAQAVAEAQFLRAWYYFHLVNIFGAIPLKTTPALTTDDLHVPVSPVSEIYDRIITDLLDASAILPVSAPAGRATRGAALGLLAKTYLFNERWSDVLSVIEDIEQLGIYSLMPVYSDNFKSATQNNVESLFEIQHITGQDPFLGNVLNQWFAPQHENGYFFNVPTEDFVNAFESTPELIFDPRLDYTVGRSGQIWINGEEFNPAWSPTGFLQKKHLQPLNEIPVGIKGDGSLNYVFMRFAEVLLMKAEALNELNQTMLALDPLNQVRKRARESYLYDESLAGFGQVPLLLLPDIITTDQQQLREIIRHERRVELGFEFHRFYDLMRYGKEYAENRLEGTSFDYEQHRYFPIPQNEVDINQQIND